MAVRSAREAAYETIRSRIITMELKPGDELNDHALAQEMGISRTPMREALIMLNIAHAQAKLLRLGLVTSQIVSQLVIASGAAGVASAMLPSEAAAMPSAMGNRRYPARAAVRIRPAASTC